MTSSSTPLTSSFPSGEKEIGRVSIQVERRSHVPSYILDHPIILHAESEHGRKVLEKLRRLEMVGVPVRYDHQVNIREFHAEGFQLRRKTRRTDAGVLDL